MNITKEMRETFLNQYANRIVEVAGWSEEDAMRAALAEPDIDALIADGFTGPDAADEEMSNWTNDE